VRDAPDTLSPVANYGGVDRGGSGDEFPAGEPLDRGKPSNEPSLSGKAIRRRLSIDIRCRRPNLPGSVKRARLRQIDVQRLSPTQSATGRKGAPRGLVQRQAPHRFRGRLNRTTGGIEQGGQKLCIRLLAVAWAAPPSLVVRQAETTMASHGGGSNLAVAAFSQAWLLTSNLEPDQF